MQSIIRRVYQYPTLPKSILEVIDSSMMLDVRNVKVQNRSGGAVDAGVLKKLGEKNMKIYQKSLLVYSEITDSLIAGSDVTLFENDDDALYFGSYDKFNYIGVEVDSDETVNGTYTLKYFNGTEFATLTPIRVIADFVASGIDFILFATPSDWAKGTDIDGIDSNLYYVEFAATAKPTTAPVITGSWLAQLLAFQEALADNGNLEVSFNVSDEPYILNTGEGIMPYFSGAAAANIAEMTFIPKK